MDKVLIAPATLAGIKGEFLNVLKSAGFELVFPKKTAQMNEDELLQELTGIRAALAGSEPYTRKVLQAHPQLRVIARTSSFSFKGKEVDVSTIAKALQLHVTTGGLFPIAATTTLTGTDAVSAALVADASIGAMPHDPSYPSTTYIYTYASPDGFHYTLGFCLETATVRGYSPGCNNFISQ